MITTFHLLVVMCVIAKFGDAPRLTPNETLLTRFQKCNASLRHPSPHFYASVPYNIFRGSSCCSLTISRLMLFLWNDYVTTKTDLATGCLRLVLFADKLTTLLQAVYFHYASLKENVQSERVIGKSSCLY